MRSDVLGIDCRPIELAGGGEEGRAGERVSALGSGCAA